MRSYLMFLAIAVSSAISATGASASCANSKAIGLARTVEIDTTGAPQFGFQHYKVHDFLQPKEVVLTFDDGPLPTNTRAVLKALADHCTRATFFPVGKLAVGYPEVLREVIKQGHSVGAHTWGHKNLSKGGQQAIEEIEKGFSAVVRAAGQPTPPFFRFPFLRDSSDMLAHLSKRNISIFSTDVDSFDFKFRPASSKQMIAKLLERLEKNGSKGIVLMHDIQPVTAVALPDLLNALRDKGYKIVHMKAKTPVKTLPEFDKLIEKDVKGLPVAGSERPTTSIVRTIANAP